MKRALWITVVAIALVLLAAVGMVARAFQRATSRYEPSRSERLVRRHELDEERRRSRRSRPLSSALAR